MIRSAPQAGGWRCRNHDEMFSEAHLSYVKSGMASQGAAFAASHL